MMYISTCLASAVLLPGLVASAQAQEPTRGERPDTDREVSLHVQDAGSQRRDIQAGGGVAREAGASTPAGADQAQDTEPLRDDELLDRLDRLEARVDASGSSRFVMTGFGLVGYTDAQGSPSNFGAQLNPVLLWELNDRLLFESELEFELEEEEAAVGLEYANLSYLVADYAAFALGKFLTPLSHFTRDLHPAWINKLPEIPLYAHHDGIVPEASLGAQLTGAVPIRTGPAKVEYSTWVSNGPALVLEGEDAGRLEFSNSEDNNNSKAVGARIGFSPTESLKVGAGGLFSRVDTPGTGAGRVSAVIATANLTYIDYFEGLGSTIDFRTEYARSHVQDPDVPYLDEMGNPLPMFDNTRSGAFFQLALRPTQCEVELVRDLELVARYDFLNGPSAVTPDRSRVTVGIDWWTSPSCVAKVAYRIDTSDRAAGGEDAFLLQWAVGF